MQKNKAQEALNLFQQLLAINPNHAEALHKVAFILHSSGNIAQAYDYYQRAIQADPQHVKSYSLLCKILESQNRGDEAIRLAHLATQVAPNNPSTHATLVSLLIFFNRVHEVPAYLEQILPHFPTDLDLHQFYCFALKVNGQFEAADAAYHDAMTRLRPPPPVHFRMIYEMHMPRLYMSVEEIEAYRAKLSSAIARFTAEKQPVNVGLLTTHPLFSLAYHNRDNKELVLSYTRMLRQLAPELNFKADHCKAARIRRDGPLRIGFISRFMHDHSVGSCYRNVMLHLASLPDFKVTFFNLSDIVDDKINEILRTNVTMIPLPKNIMACKTVIAQEKIDILIYTDIGMDAMTHYLAMMRLAPYQACFQGHPETTGIDTIDYVISSGVYEPEHADENYSERLLCTSTVDTIFTRPAPPEKWLARVDLELPEGKNLYVCPMAIQKFHPDFDDVLADILARDPNAMLVLFNDFQQHASSARMQERLLAKCDEKRIIFMPWLPREVLFSVIKACDAVLDTIYFGGGTTAQYAFGLGIPIVTMPGRYARGRMVYGYYSVMGITAAEAPIASDVHEYVTLAVKLANDKEYARALSEKITSQNYKLFEGDPYIDKVAPLMHDIMNQNLDAYRRNAAKV